MDESTEKNVPAVIAPEGGPASVCPSSVFLPSLGRRDVAPRGERVHPLPEQGHESQRPLTVSISHDPANIVKAFERELGAVFLDDFRDRVVAIDHNRPSFVPIDLAIVVGQRTMIASGRSAARRSTQGR
jgi:hypothetical protein